MAEVIMQTRDITKYYGKTLAVDHFNLSIRQGCVCGFVGRNGAGKTTIINRHFPFKLLQNIILSFRC